MRIVTWNCCRGPFDKKMAALESLQPDVAIIPEAMAPAAQTDSLRWFPSNASRLGIQVRAFNGYRLAPVRKASAALPNCVSPVRVTHGESGAEFHLLAVWTWPAPSYSRAFLNGLAAYARLLKRGPAIVAGDFNGSPFFDRPTARIKRWATGFEQLHAAGLVSAYHRHHQVAYGGEAHATHHFLRKPERPFHIDFCFVPQAWAEQGLAVHLVNDEPWRRLSDHFPLVVDVELRPA
ncbi:endonuclease/exonuclease/phosphatase family protein [Roseateles sp. NT4]|uniref:endonuclease/exonuclease/phosphatase family protein n=1 Tax=Roseateles sp. NT4 TaxID=3453715 RepID=UPI003EEB7868